MTSVVEIFTAPTRVVEVPRSPAQVVEVPRVGVSPAQIGAIVEEYLDAHPPAAGVSEQFVDDTVTAHAESATPHPVYDDGPSLVLIFENGLA